MVHLVLLFYLFVFINGENTCPEQLSPVISSGDTVKWSSTDESNPQISSPLCLSSERQLISKKCKNGLWHPPKVVCDYIQWGYVYDKSFFPKQGKCPEKSLQIDNEHCVLIERHRRLRWHDADRRCHLFNLNTRAQQNVFNFLSKIHYLDGSDKCWIGLQRINNSFFWNNNDKVDFVNWSPSVKYDVNRRYGVVMHTGAWLILDDIADMACSVCLRKLNVENTLTLRRNTKNELLLFLRQWPIAWNLKCYVDLINEDHKKEIKTEFIHEVFLSSKTCTGVYQLNIDDIDLGYYTCEASIPSGNINAKGFWFQKSGTPPTIAISFVFQESQFKSFQENGFIISTYSGKKLLPRKPRHVTWRELLKRNNTNVSSELNLKGNHIIDYDEDRNEIKYLLSRIQIRECGKDEMLIDHRNKTNFIQSARISLDQKNFFVVYIMNINDYLDMNITDLKLIMYWLRPIAGCVPESVNGLSWPYTKRNQRATSEEICLTMDGLPIARRCFGGSIEEGVYWETLINNCSPPNSADKHFYERLNEVSSFEDIPILIENVHSLTVTQLFYIAREIESSMKSVSLQMKLQLLDQISMKISAKSILLGQQFNTTSLLAAAVDQVEHIDINEHQIIKYNQSITFLSLARLNITGLAILKNQKIVLMPKDLDWDSPDLGFEINQLVIAAWLPKTALEGIPEETPIKITFLNNHFFPGSISKHFVVAISVEGYTELPGAVPIILGFEQKQNSKECVYWDLNLGNWSTEGGEFVIRSDEMSVCLYSHLTHFARLLLDATLNPNSNLSNQISSVHNLVLEWFTFIGCIFSLIGVFGILLTAIFFRSWREKPGSRILVHLSVTLGLQNSLFLVSSVFNYKDLGEFGCLALGAALHLVLLASFGWTLVSAWLQYVRFIWVIQTGLPKYFTLKSGIAVWGVSFIFVTMAIFWDPQAYISNDFCFVFGAPAVTFLLAPVVICVSLNSATYILIAIAVFRGPDGNWRSDKSIIYAQLRLGILLFFLLGLSWTFGLLSRLGGGLVFMYLFCATATTQGFVLLIFYIILNPETRKLWMNLFKQYFFQSTL